MLFDVVARQRWGWPACAAAGLTALFLVVDLAFLGANLVKISTAAGCRSRIAAASTSR